MVERILIFFSILQFAAILNTKKKRIGELQSEIEHSKQKAENCSENPSTTTKKRRLDENENEDENEDDNNYNTDDERVF